MRPQGNQVAGTRSLGMRSFPLWCLISFYRNVYLWERSEGRVCEHTPSGTAAESGQRWAVRHNSLPKGLQTKRVSSCQETSSLQMHVRQFRKYFLSLSSVPSTWNRSASQVDCRSSLTHCRTVVQIKSRGLWRHQQVDGLPHQQVFIFLNTRCSGGVHSEAPKPLYQPCS